MTTILIIVGIAAAVLVVVLLTRGKKSKPVPQPRPVPEPRVDPEPIPEPRPVPEPIPEPIPKPAPVLYPVPQFTVASYIPPDRPGDIVTVWSSEAEDLSTAIQNVQDRPNVGKVIVDGGGPINRQIVLRTDTVFRNGNYDLKVPEYDHAPFQIMNNVKVSMEDAWILESLYVGDGRPAVMIFQAFNSHYGQAENIALLGIRIKGRQTDFNFSGARSAINLGNCRNGAVIDSVIEGCASIGIAVGGTSIGVDGNPNGLFGDHILIYRNKVSGNAAAAIAPVNSRDVVVAENHVFDIGRVGGPGGVSGIDIETNFHTDRCEDLKLFNNHIDYSNAKNSGSAILAQNVGQGSPHSKGLLIANNQLVNNTPEQNNMTSGVFFTGAFPDGIVANNLIKRTAQAGIQCYGAEGTKFLDNSLTDVGGGGLPAVYIGDSHGLTFLRNPIIYTGVGPGSGEVWEVNSSGNSYDFDEKAIKRS